MARPISIGWSGRSRRWNVEEEPLTKAKGSFLAGVTQDKEDPEAGEDDSGDDGEASPGDAAEVEAFLAEVTDVEESVALEMLAAFEKDGSGRGNQRRTWRQNKDRKLAARKDRRVFSKPRVSMSDLNLKERTRCANCGERGHWQAECRKPYRSKEERNRAEARNDDKGKRAVSFVYLGFPAGQAEGNTFVGMDRRGRPRGSFATRRSTTRFPGPGPSTRRFATWSSMARFSGTGPATTRRFATWSSTARFPGTGPSTRRSATWRFTAPLFERVACTLPC